MLAHELQSIPLPGKLGFRYGRPVRYLSHCSPTPVLYAVEHSREKEKPKKSAKPFPTAVTADNGLMVGILLMLPNTLGAFGSQAF